ncbi:MAG: hypothetical protein P8R42_24210 [Candidatus Binatia bacterium]|nr:hypothetical protein [Candidatus Binatia bacterium]
MKSKVKVIEPLLNPAGLAEAMGMSAATITLWRQYARDLPTVGQGRSRRHRLSDVIRWFGGGGHQRAMAARRARIETRKANGEYHPTGPRKKVRAQRRAVAS